MAAVRITVVAFITGLLVGCGVGVFDPGEDRLLIVATTGPVGDALRNLAGERVKVEVLMGPGMDPHTYNAVPSDLRKLDAADAVFFNGLHLEGRLGDAIESLEGKKPVVSVTSRLVEAEDGRLLKPDGYEGLFDPHVWHDVSLWSDCVAHIADRLCEIDPSGAEAYRQNAAVYADRLAALHEESVEKMATIPEAARMLATAHDAFAYFSKAYGVESVALKGVSTEDEVDLGQMEFVAQMLAERGAPCVFIESAVSPRIVEALVEATATKGHTVTIGGELYADALGPEGSGADDYVGMIRANVDTIVRGLQGPVPAAVE